MSPGYNLVLGDALTMPPPAQGSPADLLAMSAPCMPLDRRRLWHERPRDTGPTVEHHPLAHCNNMEC